MSRRHIHRTVIIVTIITAMTIANTQKAYYIPDIVLSVLHLLTHLNLRTLRQLNYYYLISD